MSNYDVSLPDDTIFRINLAWISDLETLKNILQKPFTGGGASKVKGLPFIDSGSTIDFA